MKQPLIGIPTLSLPGDDWRPARYGLNQAYARAVEARGGLPVLLPLVKDESLLQGLFERLDGLLLPGGADLDTTLYGKELPGEPEPERDALELQLAVWAYGLGKPTLGICRGQQLINVALGGTLVYDLDSRQQGAKHHSETRQALVHEVQLDKGSQLGAVMGERSLEVNSLHHQAVDRLGGCLMPSAYAPDHVVEAIEAIAHPFYLAVQWHPEELNDEASHRLFDAFIRASAVRRS